MKIGIVLHPYGEEKPGGLPRVIFEWTKALIERDKKNQYIVYLKNKPKKNPDLPGNNWKLETLGGGIFWQDKLKDKEKADIYIFNTPVLPLFFRPPKSIIIAYDFPYKYLPSKNWKEYIQYKVTGFYHLLSLKRADAIISVSKSTKDEVVKFFGISPEKITPIYHGFKRICTEPETVVSVPDKFFFFAGTIKERKNVWNIVKAFNLFKKENPNTKHKVVIGGKKAGEYYEKIVNYAKENNLEQDVIFLDHINDSQLSYVYKKAEALIFPSLIEGTGNPILEAMDCGIPVITSNIFGPAELGDDGSAVLIDPYNPEDIKKAMVKITKDSDFRNKLIKKGFEQVKKFSWDIAYKETLSLLNRIYKKNA